MGRGSSSDNPPRSGGVAACWRTWRRRWVRKARPGSPWVGLEHLEPRILLSGSPYGIDLAPPDDAAAIPAIVVDKSPGGNHERQLADAMSEADASNVDVVAAQKARGPYRMGSSRTEAARRRKRSQTWTSLGLGPPCSAIYARTRMAT